MKLILLYNTPYNYATEFDGAFKRLLIVIQNSFGHFNAEEEEGFFYSFLRHTTVPFQNSSAFKFQIQMNNVVLSYAW